MDSYSTAVSIVKRLVDHGHTAYFAGGWVRDHIMGNESDDIDIATTATPEQIIALFPKTIQVGIAFGVVIVVLHGHQYEVATFRKDIEYTDGRKPSKIIYCEPKEDALRRDFTINGMFYDPLKHEIYDFVDGKRDIHEGIIRTIGDPYERFIEDRLRMIRAFRFSSRFEFTIDPETQEAIRANADTLFPPVAIERVWQELTKMATSPHFDTALIGMHRLGLLQVIFPALADIHLNDIKKQLLCFPHMPTQSPAILYILQLFPNSSLQEMLDLCLYLKTSRQESKLVETYFQTKALLNNLDNNIEWVHLLAHNTALLCIQTIAAALPTLEGKEFLALYHDKQHLLQPHIHRAINKTPLINGALLQAEGIPSGKKMGNLMKLAEVIAIEHDIHDPSSLMALLKQSPQWKE